MTPLLLLLDPLASCAALATAPPPDAQFSGEWVIALVVAIVSAILGFFAKGAVQTVRTAHGDPLQTVDARAPNWTDFVDVERRVEKMETEMVSLRVLTTERLGELAADSERRATRLLKSQAEGNGKIHARLDELTRALGRLEGFRLRDDHKS